MRSVHQEAESEFEKGLDDLGENEKESILSIVAIYEEASPGDVLLSQTQEPSASNDLALKWLINKTGNEGVQGINWATLMDEWKTQHPDIPTSVLHATVSHRQDLFKTAGEQQSKSLRLTTDGYTRFLNSQ